MGLPSPSHSPPGVHGNPSRIHFCGWFHTKRSPKNHNFTPSKHNQAGDMTATSASVCPITLEEIPPELEFSFERSGNAQHQIRFHASSLIDYMLTSGDYCDPESRVPFSHHDLVRLDEIGQRLAKPSVLQGKHAFCQSEAKFRQDAMFGLERVCGELVGQMFDRVEQVGSGGLAMDEACVEMDAMLLPDLADCLAQLMVADSAFAEQSVVTFECFLLGPPSRPVPASPMQTFALQSYRSAVQEARLVSQAELGNVSKV
ncbi:hypothetical protein BASA81_000015 [Batrachochytrium salamandrivorans]|nr:hypothetical protein BASA81_000015 [Batrachochytrium salamandrivorans]